ncbi:hypothetical protein EVA_16579 [gut metagenome]|uniref:Uncharacterized protein n=1 Tax=gut metagenome TaxID=749906 RepID=J9C642_9ZZZZ
MHQPYKGPALPRWSFGDPVRPRSHPHTSQGCGQKGSLLHPAQGSPAEPPYPHLARQRSAYGCFQWHQRPCRG